MSYHDKTQSKDIPIFFSNTVSSHPRGAMSKDLIRALKKEFSAADDAIFEYVQSYVADTPVKELLARSESIQDQSALYEFLHPLLVVTSSDGALDSKEEKLLLDLCAQFEKTMLGNADPEAVAQAGARLLHAPVQINEIKSISAAAEYTVPKPTTDISLTNVRTTLSSVDRKKLEKAEARLLKKQQEAKDRIMEKWGGYVEEDDIEDPEGLEDDLFRNTIVDPTLGKGTLILVVVVVVVVLLTLLLLLLLLVLLLLIVHLSVRREIQGYQVGGV